MTRKPWNRPLMDSATVFVALLLLFCILKVWNYGEVTPGIDFREKWEVGQAIAQSNTDGVYFGNDFGYHVSTPFLYTLLYLFSSDNYGRDLTVFRLLCLAGSVLGIMALCRLLKYSPIAAMAAVVVFMDWFQPLLSDVRVANVNQLQLGLLALFLWLQSKRTWRVQGVLGGIVLGFCVMSKPNLVFVVLLLGASWLINRRFRKFALVYAGILIAAVAAFVASAAAYGSFQCWKDWMYIVPKVSDYRYDVASLNSAPAKLIFDWIGIKTSAYLSVAFTVIATAFIWMGRSRAAHIAPKPGDADPEAQREVLEDMFALAAGCLVYLLSATLVWLHYFFLTVPMALLVLRPLKDSDAKSRGLTARRALAVAAIVLLAEMPIRTLFGVTNPYHSSVLLDIGTITLFGLGMAELARLGRSAPSHETTPEIGANHGDH